MFAPKGSLYISLITAHLSCKPCSFMSSFTLSKSSCPVYTLFLYHLQTSTGRHEIIPTHTIIRSTLSRLCRFSAFIAHVSVPCFSPIIMSTHSGHKYYTYFPLYDTMHHRLSEWEIAPWTAQIHQTLSTPPLAPCVTQITEFDFWTLFSGQ